MVNMFIVAAIVGIQVYRSCTRYREIIRTALIIDVIATSVMILILSYFDHVMGA